jgi:hypothetical protein
VVEPGAAHGHLFAEMGTLKPVGAAACLPELAVSGVSDDWPVWPAGSSDCLKCFGTAVQTRFDVLELALDLTAVIGRLLAKETGLFDEVVKNLLAALDGEDAVRDVFEDCPLQQVRRNAETDALFRHALVGRELRRECLDKLPA